jgi:Ca-activated chloride channel family protein
VADFAKKVQAKPGELAENRGKLEDRKMENLPAGGKGDEVTVLRMAKEAKGAYDKGRDALRERRNEATQAGKLGVDLSVCNNALRCQERLTLTAQRNVFGRNCLEVGGVWIDDGFDAKGPTLTVKAMSDAYFKLLEKHPKLKEVFKLGNHLVWVAPNGTALVIDTSAGKDTLTDEEIENLFVAKK